VKHLILTADDLGADVPRNAGIFEAIEAGVVTSASILVNGRAFQHALANIHTFHTKASIGVHLNLSEGRPLSSDLKSIIGPDGCFLGKAETHRMLAASGSEILRKEIRQEFAAQIAMLRDAGVPIDHLDGHQHIHVFPAALAEAIWAANEFGIRWIRIPEEPSPTGSLAAASYGLAQEAENFSRYARDARVIALRSGLKMTDHFRGLYLKGFMSLEHLEEVFQTLPSGVTELMTHPGRAPAADAADVFAPFSNSERERELVTLKDVRFRSMLEKYNIQLSPFPEACS
jgi:chitin disaccharide deacetylase